MDNFYPHRMRFLALTALCISASASAGAPVFNLADLDGSNGFRVDGVSAGARTSASMSTVADMNGDGIGDLIIAAPARSSVYVLFGTQTPRPAAVSLADLDGTNGFEINGLASPEQLGFAVSGLGDINGDGIDDMIVGAAPRGHLPGRCFVVFGRSTPFDPVVNVLDLDGTDGFRLDGAVGLGAGVGLASAGDFNGDGLSDVLIGEPFNSANGELSGRTYVVFGSADPVPASRNLAELSGAEVLRIDGQQDDLAGFALAGIGNFNADDYADILIGAPITAGIGLNVGRSYVVYGRPSTSDEVAPPVRLGELDPQQGFVMFGEGGNFGATVSGVGDFNGDGLGDLMIGAPNATGVDLRTGRSYVLFGTSEPFPEPIMMGALDGNAGFKLDGEIFRDKSGNSISGAGDVNGDGFADLVIGAADALNSTDQGRSYVVYGHAGPFPSEFLLELLDGRNGYKIDGAERLDQSGSTVAGSGDLNGDGLADVVIGAANAPRFLTTGRAYVIYGTPETLFADGMEGDNPVGTRSPDRSP